MELSDKIIGNLLAMAANSLRGDRTEGNAMAMAELWHDIAQAEAYLKAKKENAAKQPAQEHA